MLSFNSFLLSLFFWVVSALVIFYISKHYKFKKSKFAFAFLASSIPFVFISILTIFFSLFSFSDILKGIIICLIGTPLWIFVLMKIYNLSLKKSFKIILIIALIQIVIFFPLSAGFHNFSTSEKSCEEKYSSFLYSGTQKEEGIELCMINKAIEENNSSICEKVVRKSTCYFRYAREKLDEKYCMNVTGESNIYSCYQYIAEIKGDKSICKYLLKEEGLGGKGMCKGSF